MEIKKFKNAYGIQELTFEKEERYRNQIIYASNGTFKTSFTKTMELWNQGRSDEVLDRLTNEVFEGEIKFNSSDQTQDESFDSCIIYKVEREEDEFFDNVRSLVISAEMQKKLKDAKEGISDVETKFTDLLKNAKINTTKYFDEFHGSDKESFYRIYNAINKVYSYEIKDLELELIDFAQIFSKAYLALNDKAVKSSLAQYNEAIEKRKKSEIFSDDFTEGNFNDVVKNLKKNNFLSEAENRSISIGNRSFLDIKELEQFYKEIIDEVFNGEEVITAYNNVKKQLGAAKAVDKIKDNLLDSGFSNAVQQERKDLLLERINQETSKETLKELLDLLDTLKETIDEVYLEASHAQTDFEKTVDEFKSKFDPVFEIEIINIADSVLGVDQPRIQFRHKSNSEVEVDKGLLDDILSSGEKSALYILEFMFRLNVKLKDLEGELLVLMDDVIETFDYSNRNGFIEYINELTSNERLHICVLTHNFEFYRTLHSRCSDTMFPYLAERNEAGKIDIVQSFPFTRTVQKYFREIDSDIKIITAIPFAREIWSNLGKNTAILTSALHYKSDTSYTLEDIIDELNNLLEIDKTLFDNEVLNTQYYDILEGVKEYEYSSEYKLSDKIVYSIASRVLIEKRATVVDSSILSGITKNQTARLYSLVKDNEDYSAEFKKLLHKVVLLTPNFAHVNTFMYNPLVDIPTRSYFSLLCEISSL